jgi:hypothetical protein
MPLRQRASLIRDRFTVKSPKLMVLYLSLAPRWVERWNSSSLQIHATFTRPECHKPLGRMAETLNIRGVRINKVKPLHSYRFLV